MNKTRLSLLCLLAFCLPAIAGALPDYYPDHFQNVGTLNRVDREHGVIVINDQALRLGSQVKVYTRNTRFGTLDQLRVGMNVGIQVRSNQVMVTEVWVLPKGFKPKRRINILK